jgi:hypothetical protein
MTKNTKTTFHNTSGTTSTAPITHMANIQQVSCITKNGNTLQLFYNSENDLLVIDLIDANEKGGHELFRGNLDEKKLLAHCK